MLTQITYHDLYFSFLQTYNKILMDDQSQKSLLDFFSQYKQQKFKKGENLIIPGEQSSGVFFLIEGVVGMSTVSSNGEDLTINTFKQNSFFPLNWVLNDSIPQHYYEARTDVVVWKAPKEDVYSFLKSKPEVVFDLMKRIYRGLDGYFMRMEYLMSGTAKNRLITELLIYAKRFGETEGEEVTVPLKLTEKDLASLSGIARETVSRELQKLKEKKLIEIENKVLTIYNMKKLEQELAA